MHLSCHKPYASFTDIMFASSAGTARTDRSVSSGSPSAAGLCRIWRAGTSARVRWRRQVARLIGASDRERLRSISALHRSCANQQNDGDGVKLRVCVCAWIARYHDGRKAWDKVNAVASGHCEFVHNYSCTGLSLLGVFYVVCLCKICGDMCKRRQLFNCVFFKYDYIYFSNYSYSNIYTIMEQIIVYILNDTYNSLYFSKLNAFKVIFPINSTII